MEKELVGYLASVLLVVSLSLRNDLKFRWTNAAAATTFVIYGLLIDSMPITVTNAAVLLINIYYLYKIYTASTEEDFQIVELEDTNALPSKFSTFYKEDLQSYFPEAASGVQQANFKAVVLRDMAIANLFCAKVHGDGTAEVLINYTIPRYRDYKVGTFIFEKEKNFLSSKGIRKIYYKSVSHKGHMDFIKKHGFKEDGSGWSKSLGG